MVNMSQKGEMNWSKWSLYEINSRYSNKGMLICVLAAQLQLQFGRGIVPLLGGLLLSFKRQMLLWVTFSTERRRRRGREGWCVIPEKWSHTKKNFFQTNTQTDRQADKQTSRQVKFKLVLRSSSFFIVIICAKYNSLGCVWQWKDLQYFLYLIRSNNYKYLYYGFNYSVVELRGCVLIKLEAWIWTSSFMYTLLPFGHCIAFTLCWQSFIFLKV